MKMRFSCAGLKTNAVFLLGSMLLVGCGATATPRLVGVPAYLVDRNPADWKKMGEDWPFMAFVILNPASGPGPAKPPASAYTPPAGKLECNGVSDLPKKGGDWAQYDYLLKCMKQGSLGFPARHGYVAAGYCNGCKKKALPAIKDEITRYYANYAVTGIFVDELPSTVPNPYLGDVRTHVKFTAWCKAKGHDCAAQPKHWLGEFHAQVDRAEADPEKEENPYHVSGGMFICNPGWTNDRTYMDYCDILVDFEGYYNTYVTYKQPTWVTAYSPTKFWHIIHTATTKKEMEKAVDRSKKRHVFWIYVTDVKNAYDRLPKYWNDLMLEILK